MNTQGHHFPSTRGDYAELFLTPVTIIRLIGSVREVVRAMSSDSGMGMIGSLMDAAHRNMVTSTSMVEFFEDFIRTTARDLGIDLSAVSSAQIMDGSFFESLPWSPHKEELERKYETAKTNLDLFLGQATDYPVDFVTEVGIAQAEIDGRHALEQGAMDRMSRQFKILLFHVGAYVGAILVYAGSR